MNHNRLPAICAYGFFLSYGVANASAYDTCLLSHIGGINNDAAVEAIKESCIRTSEVILPLSSLQLDQDLRPSVEFEGSFAICSGLSMTINNNTGYQITGLTVSVENLKTKAINLYTLNEFIPANVISTGPASDFMLLGPGLHEFAVDIMERPSSPTLFRSEFGYNIVSAKGISIGN